MKKFLFLFCLAIIPVFAYEVYSPQDFDYKKSGDKLLFVVDYSNSMGEYLEHKTKANQVRAMMNYILPQISPDTKVGLRVYGHTCNLIAYNACRSSELVVPLGFANSHSIISEMSHLRPRGMTPITYSLKQAVNSDFAGVNGKKRIILLSDGGENCDESPCDYVLELTKTRQDIFIDVIAFNIYDTEANNQLKCTALVTGGKFYSANTSAELLESLQNSFGARKEVQGKVLLH